MTVIIQQDSLNAWVGLAGVVVGGLLTGGLNWLRRKTSEASGRDRERHRLSDDLVAGANASLLVRRMYAAGQARGEGILPWTQLMMAQAERVQKAAEGLIRLGPQELGEDAQAVSDCGAQRNPWWECG
jgi:hypothetical protein